MSKLLAANGASYVNVPLLNELVSLQPLATADQLFKVTLREGGDWTRLLPCRPWSIGNGSRT